MILLLVLISIYLGLNVKYYLIPIIILFVILEIFLFVRFKKKIAIFSLCFFLLGIGISFIKFDFNQKIYSGVVVESKENYFIFESKLEKLYIYDKSNNYEVGDILSIEGNKKELSFNKIESQFDFKYFLNKKGVDYELSVKNVNVNFYNPIRIKNYKARYLSKLSDDSASLVNSIIFSDVDDSDIVKQVKSLHLSKLLSTSGLYLVAFNYILVLLFSIFFKKKWAKLCSIFALLFYSIFTFPKFSVLRFLLLCILRWINDYLLNKKYSYFTILSISGLSFILIDYHLTYTISFLLGYLIPIISYYISNMISKYKRVKRKVFSYVFLLLFFIPFEIMFYHEFSIFSFAFQIILSPLFVVYSLLGFVGLFNIPVYGLIDLFTKSIKGISYTLSFFQISIYIPQLNWVMLFIYYALYFLFIYSFEIGLKPVKNISIMAFLLLGITYSLPIKNIFSEEVSFINVGQGDSCLIRKKQSTILIDTGGSLYSDIANDCLIPFLKNKRIYNIDLLITTHNDFDHCGAKNELMKNFTIKNYITSNKSFPISINGITFTNYNNYVDDTNEDNEKSLVIGFNLCNKNFLITGDAPISIEKKIMKEYKNINCDILKVGHHGSDTSTCDEFIKYLSPKEAVVSVGKNYYGHPSKSVLNILSKNKVITHRTDIEGTVSYFSYAL